MPTRSTAIVLVGGGAPPAGAVLPAADRVLAADGGLALAGPLGLTVDLVVGDLDSVDPEDLRRAQAHGAAVERHPEDKDRSDLELALRRAVELGATRLVVVGGAGGRADHHLANVAVLADPALGAAVVEAHLGTALVQVCRGPRAVEVLGGPGDLVSLLPIGGTAHGVTTDGLRWPLAGEDLTPWSARGLSNELVGARGAISVTDGVLLVVQPEHHAAPAPPPDPRRPGGHP